MSIIGGPIKETEAAAVEGASKIVDDAEPHLIRLIDAVFQRIWRTRIVIEIQERP